MCTGGCGGNKFVQRTPTSQPYTPVRNAARQNIVHRPASSSSNGSRASQFGTPKVRATFSGRK